MFSVSKINCSKLFFFSFRKMCLLDKVVCISLVLVLVVVSWYTMILLRLSRSKRYVKKTTMNIVLTEENVMLYQ